MKYCSVCSGVEAASLAWNPLGWEPVFFSEIEPFPSAVLMQKFGATKPLNPLDPEFAGNKKEKKQRDNWIKQIKKFPEGGTIPNLGDLTKIKGNDYHGAIDVLIGGTPCQSFSIAGKRAGLAGQSGLALHYIRLLSEIKPGWFVWENVPGVLSSGAREDFKAILEAFVEIGYHVAWRVFDTQYVRVDGFGRAIPQRRRRVFVVGNIGNWRNSAKVLFDSESLSRNPPPRRKERQGAANGFEVGPSGGRQSEVSATLDSRCKDGAIRNQVGMLCMAHGQKNAEVCKDKSPTLNCNHEAPIIFHGSQDPIFNGETANAIGRNNGLENCICYENYAQDSRIKDCGNVSPQLNAKAGTGGNNLPLIQYAIPIDLRNAVHNPDKHDVINRQGCGIGNPGDPANTLSGGNCHGIAYNRIVRRLTPLECERLMGFPDNHTLIEWKGKPKEQCPDGPRYKACGNSFSVNIVRWIGKRIQKIKESENASKN